MNTRPTILLATIVLASGASTGVAACGSRGQSSAAIADAGAETSTTPLSGDAGSSDTDAAAPPAVGDAGDGGVPYGDRNLQLQEPYPDTLLIQNGGRFYNLMNPPTSSQQAAKGDGVTDDTGAFLDAFDFLRAAYISAAEATGSDPNGTYTLTNYWIYLPAGTYRVSDTLTYRDPIVLEDGGAYADLVRVRIVGESRESTVIKLDDSAAGFGDPTHPKIVLEFQHDGTVFNNWPATNVFANTTIDVGQGNPGAIGLWFQGANVTNLYNVLLQSTDGAGFCGLIFQSGSTHGYYRDFTVVGFDNGVCQIPTPSNPANATPNVDSDTALEHVTLRGQSKAGVLVQAGGTSLRNFWVDESATGATGLAIQQVGATVVIDDSLLAGNGQGAAIERDSSGTGQVLLARDIVTTGYGSAIAVAADGGAPAVVVAGPEVDEYVSAAPIVLFDGGVASTLRLPVQDTPLVPWFDAGTQWANVADYGADGGPDDSIGVQAAMNAGKPVVVFPGTSYQWNTTVEIPATVQRVDFLYSQITGEVEVSEASTAPLVLARHGGRGDVLRSASRPLVLVGYSGEVENTSAVPANLYLENVVNIGDTDNFAPAGQSTWARFIDNEQPNAGQIDVWANGGVLWVFGFKTENKPVSVFAATNGARVEVLNGEIAQTLAQGDTFMISSDGSSMSFTGFTDLGYNPPFSAFTHIIQETQGDAGATVITDGTPQPPVVARGWVQPGTSSVDIVIPLYSARAADAGP